MNGSVNCVAGTKTYAETLLGVTVDPSDYAIVVIPITANPQLFSISIEKGYDRFYTHVYSTAYTGSLQVDTLVVSKRGI